MPVAGAPESGGEWTSLFNGRDVSGWSFVENEGVKVENGCLELIGAGEIHRRVEAAEFEFRGRVNVKGQFPAAQGGISLGRPDKSRGKGIRFTLHNDGDVHIWNGSEKIARSGSGKLPPGRWQRFLIRATGSSVTMEVEGAKIVGADVPALKPGFLALYSNGADGSHVAFKDLELRLGVSAPAGASATGGAAAGGAVSDGAVAGSPAEKVGSGGGTAAAGRPASGERTGETARPALPPVSDEKALVRAAYARYRKDLLDAFRKRNADAARGLVEAAKANPILAGKAAEIAPDATGAEWLDAAKSAMKEGLAKINDQAWFELKTDSGDKYTVGKSGKYKVRDVTGETIILESPTVKLPLLLDRLTGDVKSRLANIGIPDDARGQLVRLFLNFTEVPPDKAEAVLPGLARRADKLKDGETAGREAEWLRRLIESAAKDPMEVAAEETWKRIEELDAAGDIPMLRWTIAHFRECYSGTAFGKAKEASLAAVFEKMMKTIEIREGYRFDFATRENFDRFLKLFPPVASKNVTIEWEKGKLLLKKTPEGATARDGAGAIFQAPELRYGRDFDLEAAVNVGVGVEEANENQKLGRTDGILYFNFTGNSTLGWFEGYGPPRFHLSMYNAYGGFGAFAFRGAGQARNGSGSPGPFEGMKRMGMATGGFLAGGKARPPATEDGKYVVRIKRRGDLIKVEVNGVTVADENLPAPAAKLIEESRVNIMLRQSGKARDAEILGFYFTSSGAGTTAK
ncbi:MAG: DUF1080 domain-containing protein [Planctomycetota bacterium]|nr:DUF1080 domain-containing protein [Planctomycetota bacterium]